MSKELLLSVFGTSIPIIISIISLITALISKNKVHKSLKEIEQVKADSAKELMLLEARIKKDNNKFEQDNRKLDKKDEALASAVKFIQELKDEIYMVIKSSNEGITVSEAVHDISISCDRIVESYANDGIELCDEGRQRYHQAKTLALEVCPIIEQNKKTIYVFDITTKSRAILRQIRDDLTDIQNILRDNRSQRSR